LPDSRRPSTMHQGASTHRQNERGDWRLVVSNVFNQVPIRLRRYP